MKNWKKYPAILLCLALLLSTVGTGFAAETRTEYTGFAALTDSLTDAPEVNAAGAVLMDARSGAVLYAKNETETLYPASITKVLTALLVLEQCDLGDTVTYSDEAVYGVPIGGSTAGIPSGAELTVEESLYAMLLVSANEAAAALGEHVSGSESAFGELMTQRAAELGCTGSQFTNASGLHDDNHYTTAHDMALILQEAMHYETFRTMAGSKTYTIPAHGGLSEPIELWNHFRMLYPTHSYYYEYAAGGKTGYTSEAGNTLVSYARQGETELICVVLHDSGHSYADSKALYEWGFAQVETVQPLAELDMGALMTAEQYDLYRRLEGTYEADSFLLLPKGTETAVSFLPADTGATVTLGNLVVTVGEETVLTEAVVYDPTTRAAQAYRESLEQQKSSDSGGGSAAEDGSQAAAPEAEPEQEPEQEETSDFLYLLALAGVAAVCIGAVLWRLWTEEQRKRAARRQRQK